MPKQRLKLYVETEFGGALVPLTLSFIRKRLILEVTKDARGETEKAAMGVLASIIPILRAANIACTTDMPQENGIHRIEISPHK